MNRRFTVMLLALAIAIAFIAWGTNFGIAQDVPKSPPAQQANAPQGGS